VSAIRLLCRYQDEQVEVYATDRVDMLTPSSDSLGSFERDVGFWLELRSAQGKPLYRQIMPDPFEPSVEVFGEPNEPNPIYRAPIEKIAGHLVLLMPDEPEADYVALVRSRPDETGTKTRQVDVARIALPKEQKQ
jgi:hypothetical protein